MGAAAAGFGEVAGRCPTGNLFSAVTFRPCCRWQGRKRPLYHLVQTICRRTPRAASTSSFAQEVWHSRNFSLFQGALERHRREGIMYVRTFNAQPGLEKRSIFRARRQRTQVLPKLVLGERRVSKAVLGKEIVLRRRNYASFTGPDDLVHVLSISAGPKECGYPRRLPK